MSQKLILDASFHLLLQQIDQEIASDALKQGCPHPGCKGKLHRADYPRSPMGLSPDFRDLYDLRISFCCSICRRRTTTVTVRFFGRRWYPAPLFILLSLLTLGINQRRLTQVKRHFGFVASESTWRRWRGWWRTIFVQTPFWQQEKGRAPPTSELNRGPFPRVLLNPLKGKFKEKIPLLLHFLAPLTAGNLRAV